MKRPTDVLVTGFAKSPFLVERSLASLRRLQHEGIVRNIHCVTWDSAELDSYAAALASISGIQCTRVPQPTAQGTGFQRGLVYQVENLKGALNLVPEDDALILKWRPDFVAKHSFIRDKIVNFEQLCEVPSNSCLGIVMPAHVLRHKFWIPWADAGQPFFFEDAVFLGTRKDAGKMITALTQDDLDILAGPLSGSFAHVVRFAKMFLPRYPLFGKYLQFFPYFLHELDYRRQVVAYLVTHGFYWHLLIAHAWIMHSQFHVDIGTPGDLLFYANAVNRNTDWSDFRTARVTSPYDGIMGWRADASIGEILPSVSRTFCRLMDDAWHKAIFTQDIADLPRSTLTTLLDNISHCRDGRLAGIEDDFYQGVERIWRAHSAAAFERRAAVEAEELLPRRGKGASIQTFGSMRMAAHTL